MANLTQTQINFRRGVLMLFIAIIVFYTSRGLLNGMINVYKYLFPPEIPPAEAKFKTLPTLKMASIKIQNNPIYILDTQTGTLPNFQDRMNVYVIEVPRPNLLSEQTVKNLATDLKFGDNFVKNGVSKLRWTDGATSRNLNADIVSRNFQLVTSTEKLTTVINNALSIRNTDAEDQATAFIKSKNLMNAVDATAGHTYTVTTPSMIVLGRLRESKVNPQSSKLMKVDVYRNVFEQEPDELKGIEAIKYKILGPNPRNGLINFYASNAQEPFKFPMINYTYWDISYDNKSEYPLTPINTIWSTISQNKGVITYLRTEKEDYFEPFKTDLSVERIEIKDIYLAYYESMDYQPYLQPIYVFEGTFITVPKQGQLPERGEIVIYYPAVRGDMVSADVPNDAPAVVE